MFRGEFLLFGISLKNYHYSQPKASITLSSDKNNSDSAENVKSRQKNPGNLFLSSFLIFQVMCEQEGSIKVALCEVVTALMSADLNERKLAEQQLEALQVTEGKKSKISSILLLNSHFFH